jgi:hypothetical protein
VNQCVCSKGWGGDNCAKKIKGDKDAAVGASLAAIAIVGAAAGGLYALRRKKIADLQKNNKEMK